MKNAGSDEIAKRSYKYRDFGKDFIGTGVNPEYNKYHHTPPAKCVSKSDSI